MYIGDDTVKLVGARGNRFAAGGMLGAGRVKMQNCR
jgi:hypothetical protein